MNKFLTHIELSFNKELILKEMGTITFHPFNDLGPGQTGVSRIPKDNWFHSPSTWVQGHVTNMDKTPEIQRVYDQVKTLTKSNDIRPRFYRQLANKELLFHQDKGTLCAINIVLSEEYGPIIFEGVDEIYYKCALINTQPRHGVKAHPEERIILKYSIFDKSYEEVYDTVSILETHDR